VVIAGLLATLAAVLVGPLAFRAVFGGTPETARARIASDVRQHLLDLGTALRADAASLRRADLLAGALAGEIAALEQLFELAASGTEGDGASGEAALTVYGPSGQALAWAGRPSEIPIERIESGPAWQLLESAFGPRLLHVSSVNGTDGRRLGTLAVERSLGTVASLDGDGLDYLRSTAGTPVSLEPSVRAQEQGPSDEQFVVNDPDGRPLLLASLSRADIDRTARRWQRGSVSVALALLACTALLVCGPLLGWAMRARTLRLDLMVLAACIGAVVSARLLLRLASPADFTSVDVFSGALYASPLAAPLLTSPFDFLLSALATASLVLIGMAALERVRTRRALHRVHTNSASMHLTFLAAQVAAGCLLLAIVILHRGLLEDTVSNTAADLLQFSLHPWNPARLALQVGLVVWHVAAIGAGVVVLRAAVLPWRRRRGPLPLLLTLAGWTIPSLVWVIGAADDLPRWAVDVPPVATAAVLALVGTRLTARYRQGSQAFRLLLVALLLTVPALSSYPATFWIVAASKRDAVETRYAPQAINQRQTVQRLMQESLAQIDALPGLEALVADPTGVDDTAAAQPAFEVWRSTGLASYPITSSVELFGADGRLASRFAFNLPDDLTATLRDDEEGCAWTIYEEVSPFFAEERRVLHAGRTICLPGATAGTRVVGTIVVHATLDYGNLPFIGSQSPYVALLQFGDALQDESLSGRDLEYSVYGWSGRPAYASSGAAWPLPADVLAASASSREPRWATLTRDGQRYSVYLQNDRGGIYALGFPVLSALGHLVNLAEIAVLAGVTGLLLIAFAFALDLARGQPSSGRALLREIRASFYRKLFLAFVAAAVIPVVTLAVLTRNYIAEELRANVEDEAVRTVSAARRVVEDLVIPRNTGAQQVVNDNLLVWVSRLIDEDVNVFRGTRLQATSERNLFASGVLATRTPAGVYRALTLRRDATTIITDRIGTFAYLVAATPLTTRLFEGMLTVPLTLRQQDIEQQIDTLNRLVLLGAVLFILAGAGLGYSLAERIADPVSRLTRATRRIARGELDVRIAATSSDELQRLVQDFNRMAEDLQRQRRELERTHRLEAWAEMARQVAHEIKNPLTPIQLNAEHLRRVHADRGRPLTPMLEDCVANILTQVGLLRTIASEFSSFASSPVVRREAISLAGLLHDTLTPYEGALANRIRISQDVPPDLPLVVVDRVLLARAVTNVIENAVHALPATGELRVEAAAVDGAVHLAVTDSGPGMDEAALARAFEPYFSTKVTGTGLGLPIARRNVELCGGTIEIASTRGVGTTVTMRLPTA